jgi:hypothetical protein
MTALRSRDIAERSRNRDSVSVLVLSVAFSVIKRIRPGLREMPNDWPASVALGLTRPRQMHPRPGCFASADEYVVATVADCHDLCISAEQHVIDV